MTSPTQGHRRKFSGEAALSSGRKHSGINVRRFVPTTLIQSSSNSLLRPSKLLLKVTMENSLSAIQVLMLPEDTVGDLIKAVLVFYEKEKRRPILKNTDPKEYDLHYSQFTFYSLKRDKKIMDLGSRTFFLCSKPLVSSCNKNKKENMATESAFPWMIFVHLLL